ncbi:MAG: class I SAM-dependent RNA methyltransferase [Lachnospiraceae bacterium]|nr:class I SAM-dependent RNA methyltransferase [Lachnospiraceae bacterium]
MEQYELIAPCHFGMEAVLKREIADLGYDITEVDNGKVTFAGDVAAIARANLFLRTTERILLKAACFRAETFDELFEGVKAIPWEHFIPRDGKFWVAKANSVSSKLFSPSDIQKITKKAMVERLKQTYHIDWFEETGASYPLRISIVKDMVTIGIDTTGESLHKRGYRKFTAPAPVTETLAAAMILLSPWRADRILVDPFCGSGTIPIEAAMIAMDMAPGLSREFTAEQWQNLIPKKVWYEAATEANDRMIVPEQLHIQGYDISEEALRMARANAGLAGVDKHIHFQKRDVKDFSSPKKYGFVISNPPYGERLSEKEEMYGLYRTIGQVMEANDTWSFFLLSGYEEAQKAIGAGGSRKKATKNRKIYNGMMKTYLYQYMGAKPPRRKEQRENE